MAGHLLDRRRVEQVRRVAEVAGHRAIHLRQVHGQVELGGAAENAVDPLHVEAGDGPNFRRGCCSTPTMPGTADCADKSRLGASSRTSFSKGNS